MSLVAIKASHLGKKYKIGEQQLRYRTLRDSLINNTKKAYKSIIKSKHGQIAHTNEIWALSDVSFEIAQGEVVGIIGRNGAGKSTLLKLLAHITNPSSGKVEIQGRVGSLLEVGTGFSNELTGRENIYLNGAILGMKKSEIDRKFDEIVSFAEVDKFIDTPTKHYSSGMYMRLAFAVAAHLEPEILLVDEVLAVGDMAFQKKCLGKIGEVATQGRTVLFVSHNMAAVQNLCQKGIFLDKGNSLYIGDIQEAINRYLTFGIATQGTQLIRDRIDRKGTLTLKFIEVYFTDMHDNRVDRVLSGQDIKVCVTYVSQETTSNANINIAFNVINSAGLILANLNSKDIGRQVMRIEKSGRFECLWSRIPLRSGSYHCNLFCEINGRIVDWIQSAFVIDVEDGDYYGTGSLVERPAAEVFVNYDWKALPDATDDPV